MNYDEHDLHSVALCAWREARGEGQDGVRAVMHVIANRVGYPGFAKDVHDVIYGRNQFTSMSVPSDPEFNLEPQGGDPQWQFCSGKAESVLSGDDPDLTLGAHYYAYLKASTSGWFERVIAGPDGNGTPEHPFTVQIGRQKFFK